MAPYGMGGGMTERKSRRPSREPQPRGLGARPVADMLPAVGGAAFRRFGFVQSAIVSRWPEIAGERYAVLCQPESIRFTPGERRDGVLTLAVASAHAPMIQHVAPTIIDRVNRFFGYPAIARVAVRQALMPPRTPRLAPPSLRPLSPALGESLRGVEDPGLRECLAALAGAMARSSGPPRIGEGEALA
jgi:hypothetical protein